MINVIIVPRFATPETKEGLFIMDHYQSEMYSLPFAPQIGMEIDLDGFKDEAVEDIKWPVCRIDRIIFVSDSEVELWVSESKYRV